MNVKNIEKENGSAKLVVEIERERFQAAVDKAYRKNRGQIMVPGFRKGKAPRKIIEGMYGASVFYDDAINDLFPDVFEEATKGAELRPVGRPSVTDVNVDDGMLTLTIETDLYPEVTLGQYKGVEVEKKEVKVTAADVNEELKGLAERNARIQTVDRAAKNGDSVVIDYVGLDNGVAFEGGSAENFTLKLGSGTFIPGFEEALVGVKADDEKNVEITFPADYHAKELAGHPVVFQCKVHEVKETLTPKMDDEFAKDVSEFDTLKELKDDLKAKKLEARKKDAEAELRDAALTKAVENMTCEVPASMVEMQIDQTLQQYENQIRMSGSTLEEYAQKMGTNVQALRTSLRPSAEAEVRMHIMLEAIVEAEKLEVGEDELNEQYEKMSKDYGMPVENIQQFVNAEDLKKDLVIVKAGDFVAANAKAVKPAKAEKTDDTAETETAPTEE
ncbi:MAG: trigger factor [Oscillospiraceae bacterium]|nr:trigger factor [Oscillospiraceae bacterium]